MEKEQKITKAELARRKREEKLAAERERIEALCEFEKEYDYWANIPDLGICLCL